MHVTDFCFPVTVSDHAAVMGKQGLIKGHHFKMSAQPTLKEDWWWHAKLFSGPCNGCSGQQVPSRPQRKTTDNVHGHELNEV